jgi:hypothetical protein
LNRSSSFTRLGNGFSRFVCSCENQGLREHDGDATTTDLAASSRLLSCRSCWKLLLRSSTYPNFQLG